MWLFGYLRLRDTQKGKDKNMRGKSLLNDISMQELSTMRENGMTNREIAEKLDVAYSCIHRILGPQPDGMRAKTRRKEKPLPTPILTLHYDAA